VLIASLPDQRPKEFISPADANSKPRSAANEAIRLS
jgi:hypothetical protein